MQPKIEEHIIAAVGVCPAFVVPSLFLIYLVPYFRASENRVRLDT